MSKKESGRVKELLEQINKDYGDNILISADFLKSSTGQFVSTGLLSWDIALEGGIREGTITHIGGVTASGKTTLCLTIAANAHKLGKNVYYIDVEGRVQDELLNCIAGLDRSKIFFIRSSAEKFLTAEEYLEIIETIIKDDPGCVIILDSLAALCPEAEYATEMNEMQRATMPKLMYKFLRKVVQIIPVNKTIFISITHMQANPSGYGSPLKDVGGNGIQFFASYWLTCMSSSYIEKDGKKVGKESKFRINKLANGPSGGEMILPICFGRGCDQYADICKLAEDTGILSKAGAWYSLELDYLKDKETGKFPKLQGMDAVKQYLIDNNTAYQKLIEKIKSIIVN